MFNTFCWCLNCARLSFIPIVLRRALAAFLPARVWQYGNGPQAGYIGGVDVALFGTVAFIDTGGALTYRW